MPKPLTDFERGLIVGLMLAKVSVSQAENILKENNMVGTQRTIQRVFKQWQDEGKTTVFYQDNCGRPSKLNEGDQQQLKQFVLQNPIVSRRELANNVTANPKQVSGQTLYKSLQDQGLFQISLQRKISISQKNKDLRVKWARKLLRNMKSQFKHTIFTDETTIIFQNERKTLCWVDTNSDNKQEKAIEYQRFPKRCMIWGAIYYEGALDLQLVEGSIDQKKYIDILKQFFKNNENDFNYFMQDNTSSHTGKETMAYFKKNNIELLDWASQSPDINPIEKCWNLLKCKLSKKVSEIKDFDEFKKLINDTFLNDADIKKLIRTSISNIKSSLEKLIELKGDAII